MEFLHEYNLLGIIIGISTFLVIGIFHPIVIKCEYYFGVGCWWWFLVLGIASMILSVVASNILLSAILGVVGFSSLWTIKELFEQRERVAKGWFPAREKR